MLSVTLIGLGAGAASALLFASIASGSLAAVLLFYLAPLPLLITALGWNHLGALFGALLAAACLSLVFGIFFAGVYFVSVALPGWWLGYLALLARPGSDAQETAEWYPPGRLLLWCAAFGTVLIIIAALNFGTDVEAFRSTLRSSFERILNAASGGAPRPDADRMLDLMVNIVPPTVAAITTLTLVLNLYLAGRVVRVSGRLRRPWPDLSATTLPTSVIAILAVAWLGYFLPGMIGVVAGVLASMLLLAYALVGFAVIHSVTRGLQSRPGLLAGSYATLILGWPLVLIAVVGIADSAMDLRTWVARRRGLPPPPA